MNDAEAYLLPLPDAIFCPVESVAQKQESPGYLFARPEHQLNGGR